MAAYDRNINIIEHDGGTVQGITSIATLALDLMFVLGCTYDTPDTHEVRENCKALASAYIDADNNFGLYVYYSALLGIELVEVEDF